MKLVFAVFGLMAVAVFAGHGDRQARYRYTEVDERDVEQFRQGQTYKYRLDTQVSSGMTTVSDQHASTRLQAEVLIHFQTDRKVSMKLNDVIVGSSNKEIQEPEKIQPMGMFKEQEIKGQYSRQLEQPLTFDYVEGLVERITFESQESAWSKNIKKAVLNMLQLNLKQRQGQDSTLDQPIFWQEERENEKSSRKNEEESKMFVMPETTFEGECQTTYVLNKIQPTNQLQSSLKMFNVTKSIDFHHCSKIADTRYGPKMQKPCENCTTPQLLEENKLDRTTVIRHMIVGTPEKYGIKKVEVLSHYVYKTLNVEQESPMQVIVVGRLSYVGLARDQERELKEVDVNGQEESLLYSMDWDEKEKLFYMYGDEEFPQQTPFEKVENKVSKIEKLFKQLLELWTDKVNGIDTEATLLYSRIVELLRMCTQNEIREVYSNVQSSRQLSESQQRRAEEIIVDALANAGTHNTIKVLTEKISKKDVQPARAVRALVQLKSVPAPSEKIVNTLIQLCQHESCANNEACRQVCWLTTGSITGQLCQQDRTVQDAVEQKKNVCPHDFKTKTVAKAMEQYRKFETRYEKILLLKALGNAGLEPMVADLEKIIRNVQEEPTVRMQAIDSLRRLRSVMPQKIQRVLMPVVQNVRERPEIRMMAVSIVLSTIPEKAILDQFGLTLIREPSRQVKSYVYGAMKRLSESSIPVEQELAKHLKSLVKMAGITEEDEEVILRGSRYYRIPVYSQEKKEGFLAEFESMVGSDSALPKHLSAGLDTYINGLFQKNSFEVSLSQEDLEQWAEKLMDIYMDYQYGESSKKSLRGNRNSQRESWTSEAQSDFRSIVQGLGIQRRSERRSNSRSNNPYGMINVRYGDVDYVILPLEDEFLPHALKKVLVDGQRPSVEQIKDLVQLVKGKPFSAQSAMHLLENSVRIPTSVGFPVRMWHVVPVLASVEGELKPSISREIQAELKVHTSLTVSHLKRVEIWTPIINTGVETSRSVAFNLPLTTKVEINGQDKPFKLTIQVPENQFRVLKLQSLPFTFVSEQDWHQTRNPVVKRIENKNLIHRAQPLEKVLGKHTFGMPLKVNGEVHCPQEKTYSGLINMIFTTENHLEVTFEPTSETPREIVLTADGQFFQPADKSSRHQLKLKGFYSNSKFDQEMDQDFEDDGDDERQINRYLDGFEPKKMLKHNVEFQLQTVGGRYEKKAQLELEAQCDNEHRFIKAEMKIKRSPLEFFGESAQWTMRTEVQAILPEVHSSVQQYRKQQQGEKNQKFVCQAEAQWGSGRQQEIKINIHGEQARNPEWKRKIEEVNKLNSQDAPKLREQMIRKVAFLNKYDISAEYSKIEPETKNFFNYLNTLLKVANFWNTQTSPKTNQRDGQITATVVIDPITHEHVNVTLKTPVETVRIQSASLPIIFKPFQLVKPGQQQQSVESFSDLVSNYEENSRAECKVDSRKIRSFDDVIFKAPLTKCYSVLAKDCSSENSRFAVLMKKTSGDEKAIKILSQGNKIEIESQDGELIVKVNGKRERDVETLESYGIVYSKDLVRVETRDLIVRFDGEQAQIKVSSFYKNQQCGLCGHYDDNTDDEFRTSQNEWTSDLKTYHKSYSLVDEECRGDLEDTYRREEYKTSDNSWRFDEDEEQDQRRRRTQNGDEIEPLEKTETMEYNHKICFSLKPVKTCPEGAYPEKTKDAKISFACLDRTSSEARRLLRQARRSDQPLDNLNKHKMSFVETITMPTTCVQY